MANEGRKTKTKQNNSEAQKPKQKCVKNDGRWGESKWKMEQNKSGKSGRRIRVGPAGPGPSAAAAAAAGATSMGAPLNQPHLGESGWPWVGAGPA